MSTPFIGEIRMFAGNFPPNGWAFCNGAIVAIAENETLFQLIGTTYGGDGQSTFALPNLQSRIPVHQGSGYLLAQTGGAEQVTLTTSQLPSHSHPPTAQSANGSNNPTNNVWAASAGSIYSNAAPTAIMNPQAIGATGGNQPHENVMPILAINFIISLFGIFPSQN